MIRTGRTTTGPAAVWATVETSTVWWQYRVMADGRRVWRKTEAITVGAKRMWTGFAPCLECEVPDDIKHELIRELMAARLANKL